MLQMMTTNGRESSLFSTEVDMVMLLDLDSVALDVFYFVWLESL